jgi:L-fucose isomerase-like protein
VPDYVHAEAGAAEAARQIGEAARAAQIARRLKQARILLVGEHPAGFDACDFDKKTIKERFGVTVEQTPIDDFLAETKALPDSVADAPLARRQADLVNLAEMDPVATRKTMKVYANLAGKARDQKYDGVAVRCWPDFFVQYGCAACGALALLNEDRIPAGCEGDMFGVVSSLIGQWASGGHVFNTDLVDVDAADDTVVFWHCGQAPIQMADPEVPAHATIHSNRKMPLLSEFPLKPGRITILRLTRGHGAPRLALGGGEMLRRPLAFSGTAGVAKLDVPASVYLDRLVSNGLEHHTTIVYGEHRPLLRQVARRLDLPVVELT